MPKKTAKLSASVVAADTGPGPVQAASLPRKRTLRNPVAPSSPEAQGDGAPAPARGRTEPVSPAEADRLFRDAVALFNGVRYWFAHEAWETLWRAAEEDERDFYQGLIQVAAGLLHLQRRNARGARNKLREGVARLQRYQPVHRGVLLDELVGISMQYLEELDAGSIPYLIPPVIRYVEVDTFDRSR
jgi:predicted metal-dependent hydrolase